ncbi:hypothetical protein [Anabaena sp. UHCC 0204]|uniref:hypothetical protein n=1 Tax=Anabaena sp. UHCC 0204 TaxID=2590009 RepID=UPI0014465334|nr:hypothetical protein [Anabaena sp. UHCC 0204]MTJ08351.1 hypothetical protein [Anabaena sp. UHCC 0204]
MKTVIKLTQQAVIGEINSVLDTYPYQPYQQAFAIPDLRQELISFVIHRLPCFHNQISHNLLLNDDVQVHSFRSKLPLYPLEQQLHLQKLIHEGISSIIRDKSDWISNYLCETVEPNCQTSHWFG